MMKKRMIESCQQILQIPGESGEEKETAHFLKDLMEELNYDRVWIDDWGNVIGLIEGKGSQTIMLEGHMDTVGVENPSEWNHAPYGGIIDNDRLYGRGASDMRSALVAMVYAGASFTEQKDKLKGDIVVVGIVQEELFEGVAQGAVLDEVNPDLVVIGEASSLNLCIGQRGRAEIKVTTFGENAHSSNPEEGINAIRKMNRFLTKVDKIEPPREKHLGQGIMEMVDIHSYPYPGRSVVPDKCVVTFDRRLLPDETEEEVLKPLHQLAERLNHEDDEFKVNIEIAEAKAVSYTGKEFSASRFFPGWIFPIDASFVNTAYNGLKKAGLKSEIDYYSFCTDGSQSAGRYNIPTVGFGPSREELAHVVDEYIELDEIEKAYQGYRGILQSFLL